MDVGSWFAGDKAVERGQISTDGSRGIYNVTDELILTCTCMGGASDADTPAAGLVIDGCLVGPM